MGGVNDQPADNASLNVNNANSPAGAGVGAGADATDPDLLIDFRGVTFVRDGRCLVGPVDWQVELDERWVIVGPNGAGKTTLVRMASAQEFPTAGDRKSVV